MPKMLDRLPLIPDGRNKDKVDYLGVTFTRDGRVFRGKKEIAKNTLVVTLTFDDTRYIIPKAGFIKRVFYGKGACLLPDASRLDSVDLGEFIMFRDGTSLHHGKKRMRRKTIPIVINGVIYWFTNARLIYSLFSGKELSHSDAVIHKDGNEENDSFDNLSVVRQKYPEQKIDNKKAKKIKDFYFSGKSIRKTAKRFSVSASTVFNIIHNF